MNSLQAVSLRPSHIHLKLQYNKIDYAYAITSHKSQGSTYDIVIVDEKDIMERLMRWGVDGIITNDVQLGLRVRSEVFPS